MYQISYEHHMRFYDFLKELDCYITSEAGMLEELRAFDKNPERKISALVCQRTQGKLSYPAPYLRILYVLEGGVKARIDGKEVTLSVGGMIFSNRFTKIDYEELQEDTRIVGFYFKPEYFTDSLLNQLADERMVYRFLIESLKSEEAIGRYYVFEFQPTADTHFYSILLLKQVVKMAYKDNQLTRAAFLLLMVEVSQAAEHSLRLSDSVLSSEILVSEMIDFMENHLKEITLEKLAQQFNFHPNYLSSLIKKETGKTFKEHLLELRLARAAYYLRSTNLSVQKISEEIGYQDRAFFFRIFKKYYEKTPGQYRNEFQSGGDRKLYFTRE